MRIFDGIGIATVAIWLGIISLTAWNIHYKPPTVQTKSDQVVLTEGESWMILRRNDADVGFIHESRTQLEKGWLLESQTIISIEMLGTDQLFKTTVKATVDEHAVIQNFTSDLSEMDSSFHATGKVDGNTMTITTYAGGSQSTQSIPLSQPPRLLSAAFNKFLAHKDLKEGQWIDEMFFDAETIDMVKMKVQYIRPSQTEIWDETHESQIFTRHAGGEKFNTFTTTDGTVLLQEFPSDILGSRVPLAIGRAKSMTLRSKVNKNTKSKKGSSKSVDISFETAVNMLNQITGTPTAAQENNAPAIPGQYTISNVNDFPTLQLSSNRQYFIAHTGKSATIETRYTLTPDTRHAALEPETRLELLENSAHIDGNAANIQALIKSVDIEKTDIDEENTTRYAKSIIRAIHQAMKPQENTEALSASQALESGRGNANQYALITVAALRQAGIPARFVHGLIYDEKTGMVPHKWIQFFDGKRFVDLDATRKDDDLSVKYIQLFTSATPEHPNFPQVLDKLSIHPTLP